MLERECADKDFNAVQDVERDRGEPDGENRASEKASTGSRDGDRRSAALDDYAALRKTWAEYAPTAGANLGGREGPRHVYFGSYEYSFRRQMCLMAGWEGEDVRDTRHFHSFWGAPKFTRTLNVELGRKLVRLRREFLKKFGEQRSSSSATGGESKRELFKRLVVEIDGFLRKAVLGRAAGGGDGATREELWNSLFNFHVGYQYHNGRSVGPERWRLKGDRFNVVYQPGLMAGVDFAPPVRAGVVH